MNIEDTEVLPEAEESETDVNSAAHKVSEDRETPDRSSGGGSGDNDGDSEGERGDKENDPDSNGAG